MVIKATPHCDRPMQGRMRSISSCRTSSGSCYAVYRLRPRSEDATEVSRIRFASRSLERKRSTLSSAGLQARGFGWKEKKRARRTYLEVDLFTASDAGICEKPRAWRPARLFSNCFNPTAVSARFCPGTAEIYPWLRYMVANSAMEFTVGPHCGIAETGPVRLTRPAHRRRNFPAPDTLTASGTTRSFAPNRSTMDSVAPVY